MSVKLYWDEVEDIRREYSRGDVTQYELADQYEVTQPNVSYIVRYLTRRNGPTSLHLFYMALRQALDGLTEEPAPAGARGGNRQ